MVRLPAVVPALRVSRLSLPTLPFTTHPARPLSTAAGIPVLAPAALGRHLPLGFGFRLAFGQAVGRVEADPVAHAVQAPGQGFRGARRFGGAPGPVRGQDQVGILIEEETGEMRERA